MADRVTIDHEGNATSQSLPDSSNYATNDSFQGGSGTAVQRGIGSIQVADQSELQDSDIVKVDGISMSVEVARRVGVLDQAFAPRRTPAQLDPQLGDNATNQPAEATEQPATPTSGHEGFDQTAAELQSKIESEELTAEEAGRYETAVAEIAMAGKTVAEMSDLADGIRDGSIDPADADPRQVDMLNRTAQSIQQASAKSASAELGSEGYARLGELARVNPEVNEAVRQYASMRALGRADVTWSQFLADAEDHVRGVR